MNEFHEQGEYSQPISSNLTPKPHGSFSRCMLVAYKPKCCRKCQNSVSQLKTAATVYHSCNKKIKISVKDRVSLWFTTQLVNYWSEEYDQ